MNKFKKGNGTMLFGTTIIITVTLFIVYFINLASLRHYKQVTQIAADSMSDSLAVYMQTGGQNYTDDDKKYTAVLKEAREHLKPLIEKAVGMQIEKITVDKYALENDAEIKVNIRTKSKYPIYLKKNMRLTAHSATAFKLNGLKNANKMIEWAKSHIGYTTYSNAPRDTISSDGRVKLTDCSGFVYFCYVKMGLKRNLVEDGAMWATSSMWKYFDEIPKSELRPGDVMIITGAERGTQMGHTRLYIGNNQMIECTSGKTMGVRIVPMNYNAEGYRYGRIKSRYME